MARTLIELNPATTANPADQILLRQGSEDRRLTIQALGQSIVPTSATTTQAGIAELATNAETQAGTDSERIVTPAALASLIATLDRRGLIELATNVEALAGTDTEKAITPASLDHVLENTSLGATGGGTDRVFFENDKAITVNYTVPATKNALTAGPVTINNGITVTVSDTSVWTVV